MLSICLEVIHSIRNTICRRFCNSSHLVKLAIAVNSLYSVFILEIDSGNLIKGNNILVSD